MNPTNVFEAQELEFTDAGSWAVRINYAWADFILGNLGAISLLVPPVTYRSALKWKKNPPLDLLARAAGFDQPATLDLVLLHQHRHRAYLARFFVIYLLFTIPLMSAAAAGLGIATEALSRLQVSEGPGNVVMVALFVIVYLLFLAVVVQAAFKVASILTDRLFADTLCVIAGIYLLLELSRDDVLTHPERRRRLLKRINQLARSTVLLSLSYAATHEATQAWLGEHFRNMAGYIRERERWAIAPTALTLVELRRDFQQLVSLFITGQYGVFTWPKTQPASEAPEPSLPQRISAGLFRFVGIILPILLLGFLLWKPGGLAGLGLDPNVLSLILTAWLLLAIDVTLKLGIVDKVINLAKAIKELR